MIAIEKGTKTTLPERFHLQNNMCSYLYDQITEILDAPSYEKMSNTDIEFNDNPEFKAMFERDEKNPLEILQLFERNHELETIVTKHLVMSLLSDMVNFIYESILIAQKGKMAVAYALVRKPFKDQLFLLEQILIDRTEFFGRFFHHGDSSAYDPSSPSINKRDLINRVNKKLHLIGTDSDFIYQSRYDRKAEWGFSAISDKAIHVVTSNKHYKTPHQDLNFAYVTPQDVEDMREHYFFLLPHLMVYTTAVIDAIVFDLIPHERSLRLEKQLKRLIALLMLMDYPQGINPKAVYQLLSTKLKVTCQICQQVNRYGKRAFTDYFFEHRFYCKKCFNPVEFSTKGLDFLEEFFSDRTATKPENAE